MNKILAIGMAAGILLTGGWARATLSYSQTFDSGASVGSVAGGNPVPSLFTGTFNADPNGGDTIQSVTITLSISGGYSGGFYLALTGPDGHTTSILLNNPGTSTSGLSLTFAAGGTAINSGSDLSSGTYAPNTSLSTLNGQLADGTWTLAFADTTSGDGGATLTGWSLTTVVPEPIRMALGLFGGLAVLWFALGLCWKKPEAVEEKPEAPEPPKP